MPDEIKIQVATPADVRGLEATVQGLRKQIDEMERAGKSADELRAKIHAISEEYAKFHEALGDGASLIQHDLRDALDAAAATHGIRVTTGKAASSGLATAPPAAPASTSGGTTAAAAKEAARNVRDLQEKQDTLLQGIISKDEGDIAHAYQQTGGLLETKTERAKEIQGMMEREEAAAKKTAAALANLGKVRAAQNAQGAEPSHIVRTEEELEAVEKLVRLKKQEIATLQQGTPARAQATQQLAALTASTQTQNAQLIRQVALLKQQAAAQQQAGNAAAASAAQQQAASIQASLTPKSKGGSGQIGSSGSVGKNTSGEFGMKEVRQAYNASTGSIRGIIAALDSGMRASVAFAAAGIAGATALAAGWYKARQAAAAMEQTQANLDAALARHGVNVQSLREAYDTLAKAQAGTVASSKGFKDAITVFTNLGAAPEDMAKLTTGVRDLAGVLGGGDKGVAKATDMMSAALQGSFGGFAQLGIHVTEAGSDAEKLRYLLTELRSRGSGDMEAFSRTTEGAAEQMSRSWEQMKAAIGSALPSMTPIRQLASMTFDAVASSIGRATPEASKFGNRMQEQVRNLAETERAAKSYAASIKAIEVNAKAAADQLQGVTDVIRAQARAEEEKADAKLAYAKAVVDRQEKLKQITPEEAARRRMSLDAQAATNRQKRELDARVRTRGAAETAIQDYSSEEARLGAENDKARKKLAAARKSADMRGRIAEMEALRDQEMSDIEGGAYVVGSVGEADAKARIAGINQQLVQAKSQLKAQLESGGLREDFNFALVEADAKRAMEAYQKFVEANRATFETAQKTYTQMTNEMLRAAEMNDIENATRNLSNLTDEQVAMQRRAQADELAAAQKKKTDAETRLQQAREFQGTPAQRQRQIDDEAKKLAEAELQLELAGYRNKIAESLGSPADTAAAVSAYKLALQMAINAGRLTRAQVRALPAVGQNIITAGEQNARGRVTQATSPGALPEDVAGIVRTQAQAGGAAVNQAAGVVTTGMEHVTGLVTTALSQQAAAVKKLESDLAAFVKKQERGLIRGRQQATDRDQR